MFTFNGMPLVQEVYMKLSHEQLKKVSAGASAVEYGQIPVLLVSLITGQISLKDFWAALVNLLG
jgi:Flp pilus assembly pilin Flp